MLIENWGKENRNFRKQTASEATYSVTILNSEKLFQIQTYGSSGRQLKGNASQTIQFNKQQAIELIDILKQEFLL